MDSKKEYVVTIVFTLIAGLLGGYMIGAHSLGHAHANAAGSQLDHEHEDHAKHEHHDH
jgi:ABC-type Zn2+ transport system substrate-binding protein/surface adhesin